jgi:chemotaxis protein MotB
VSVDLDDPPAKAGAPAWMATFGDMMSLLLCFFVLLLSFANMDIVKFREMLGSVKDAFGVRTENMGQFDAKASQPRDAPEAGTESTVEFTEDVRAFIENSDLQDVVEAVPGERGVTIRITGKLMFESASDELRTTGQPVLDEIVDLAKRYPNTIGVEGHTDDRPINSARYQSNWSLSAARAVAGVRYMIDVGGIDPARISATGFAHTRPIASNDTEEDRAMNRRLEFVFFKDTYGAAKDKPVEAGVAEDQPAEAGVAEDKPTDAAASKPGNP